MKTDARYFTPLQTLSHWERTQAGIRAQVDHLILVVELLGDGIIRIEIAREGAGRTPTYAVCAELPAYGGELEVIDTAEELQLISTKVRVVIGTSPFRLSAYRADGSTIFESTDESYAHLNDEFIVTRRCNPDDRVLGLGQKTGRLNRAGRRFTLWNTDVLNPNSAGAFNAELRKGDPRADPTSTEFDPYYISIPFYQRIDSEGKATGFFIDNVHMARYEFDREGEHRIRFAGGSYVEYIFSGPTLAEILADYSKLTGRMQTPPLWALGYHHCRWHPYSQTDVLAIAAKYREKSIPCDSVWLDIDHMDGYRVFTWDQNAFPDPQGMLCELGRHGFRAVTIVDPGVKVEAGYTVYDSGLASDSFCQTEAGAVYEGQVWPGKTAFPDFASAKARAWWGKLNAQHVQVGLAGIWNDMNEPATGDIPADAMRFDGGKLPHQSLHNAYSLLMAMATVEGLRKAAPNRRSFVLSRAGSAGIQRFAANWLGDNMSRWDHLRMSVAMSLGLGLSGQPFVGSDIGGFGEDCTPELLVRWFQAAALSPFCRHHNAIGNRDQYPWSFGAEVESLCRESLELRYRLMPYLYSCFVESAETGLPVMRAMAFEDPALADLDDQYLLGPALLVAPVLEEGLSSRQVVIPDGCWFDWWTGRLQVSRTVFTEAPLGRIPMFARGGAVIPLWPEVPASTMSYNPEVVELQLFVPPRDGAFRSFLVEDDGETLGFERGERLRTEFLVTREGSALRVEGRTSGRPYPGFGRKSFRIVLRGVGSSRVETLSSSEGSFVWTTSLHGTSS